MIAVILSGIVRIRDVTQRSEAQCHVLGHQGTRVGKVFTDMAIPSRSFCHTHKEGECHKTGQKYHLTVITVDADGMRVSVVIASCGAESHTPENKTALSTDT